MITESFILHIKAKGKYVQKVRNIIKIYSPSAHMCDFLYN